MCRGPKNHYCKAAKCYKNAHKRVISGDRSPLTGFLSFPGTPPPGSLRDEEAGARVSAAPGELAQGAVRRRQPGSGCGSAARAASPSSGPQGLAGVGLAPWLFLPRDRDRTPLRLPARGHGSDVLGTVLPSGVALQVRSRLFPDLPKAAARSPRVTQSLSLLQEGLARRPPLPRRAVRRVEAAPGH